MAINNQPVPIPRQIQPMQAPARPDNAGMFFQALAARQAQQRDQQMAHKALSDTVMTMADLYEKKRKADMENAQAGALLEFQQQQFADQQDMKNRVLNTLPEEISVGGRPAMRQLKTTGWDVEMLPAAPGSAAVAANTIDARAAKAYEMESNVPADYFLGQNRRDVTQQLISLRPAKKQADALLQTENIVKNLKTRWEAIQNDVGPVEGRGRAILGKLSGGKYEDKLAAYERFRNAGITSMRKLFNDSGAPSNFDTERFFDSIPGSSIAKESAMESWGALDGQLASGRNSLVQTYPLVKYTLDKGGSGAMSARDFLVELAEKGTPPQMAKAMLLEARKSGKVK